MPTNYFAMTVEANLEKIEKELKEIDEEIEIENEVTSLLKKGKSLLVLSKKTKSEDKIQIVERDPRFTQIAHHQKLMILISILKYKRMKLSTSWIEQKLDGSATNLKSQSDSAIDSKLGAGSVLDVKSQSYNLSSPDKIEYLTTKIEQLVQQKKSFDKKLREIKIDDLALNDNKSNVSFFNIKPEQKIEDFCKQEYEHSRLEANILFEKNRHLFLTASFDEFRSYKLHIQTTDVNYQIEEYNAQAQHLDSKQDHYTLVKVKKTDGEWCQIQYPIISGAQEFNRQQDNYVLVKINQDWHLIHYPMLSEGSSQSDPQLLQTITETSLTSITGGASLSEEVIRNKIKQNIVFPHHSPTVYQSQEIQNFLQSRVIFETLSEEDPLQRALCLERWIMILNQCFDLRNYPAVNAILQGINKVRIQIPITMRTISSESSTQLDSIENNFASKKLALYKENKEDSIPFIPLLEDFNMAFSLMEQKIKDSTAQLEAASENLEGILEEKKDHSLENLKNHVSNNKRLKQTTEKEFKSIWDSAKELLQTDKGFKSELQKIHTHKTILTWERDLKKLPKMEMKELNSKIPNIVTQLGEGKSKKNSATDIPIILRKLGKKLWSYFEKNYQKATKEFFYRLKRKF